MIPTLETPRLHLRPFTLEDAPRVQMLAGDARVSDTTLNLPHPYPDGVAEEWIQTHADDAQRGERFTWAIAGSESGAVMGSVALMVNQRHSRGALGYWLGFDFWNKGFMTEAVRAVLQWGFSWLGLHRIEAACYSRNPNSYRVMEKCRMQREGLFRGYYYKNNNFEDLYQYAILRTDQR